MTLMKESTAFNLDSDFDDCMYGMLMLPEVRIPSQSNRRSYNCPCVGYGLRPPPVHEIAIPANYYISLQSKGKFRSEVKGRGRGRGRDTLMTSNSPEPFSTVGTVKSILPVEDTACSKAEYGNQSVSSRVMDWLSNTPVLTPNPNEPLDESPTDMLHDGSILCSSPERWVCDVDQDNAASRTKTRAERAADMKSYVKFRDSFLKESPPGGADVSPIKLSSMYGLNSSGTGHELKATGGERAMVSPEKSRRTASKNLKQNRRLNAGNIPEEDDWKLKCNIRAAHQSGFALEDGDNLMTTLQKMLQSENDRGHITSTLGVGMGEFQKPVKEPVKESVKTYDDHFPTLQSQSSDTASMGSSRKGSLNLKSIASSLK